MERGLCAGCCNHRRLLTTQRAAPYNGKAGPAEFPTREPSDLTSTTSNNGGNEQAFILVVTVAQYGFGQMNQFLLKSLLLAHLYIHTPNIY